MTIISGCDLTVVTFQRSKVCPRTGVRVDTRIEFTRNAMPQMVEHVTMSFVGRPLHATLARANVRAG